MSTIESKKDCVGTYPSLWRIVFTHESAIRVQSSCGEMENTGRYETIVRQYDVIALSEGLAIESFKLDFPAGVGYVLRSGPDRVCFIDAAVGVSKNYGGHFS